METKVCKECGQSLPISNFSKNKATKDGLANYCKKCDKERRRKSSGGITQQGVKATLKMSDFDDNMLFAELRRRGYTGELRYSKALHDCVRTQCPEMLIVNPAFGDYFDVAKFREEISGKRIRLIALVTSFVDASLLTVLRWRKRLLTILFIMPARQMMS